MNLQMKRSFYVTTPSLLKWPDIKWIIDRTARITIHFIIFAFLFFGKGRPWHLNNYAVWIHSKARTSHDKNM